MILIQFKLLQHAINTWRYKIKDKFFKWFWLEVKDLLFVMKFNMFPLKYCLKLSCYSRFQHAFTACSCVFKVLMLVSSNQGNYFENALACSKRTLKTRVATQLYIWRLNAKTSLYLKTMHWLNYCQLLWLFSTWFWF